MNDLRLWANYYYNMGFNVTHIIPHLNEGKAKNPYKSPTNDRHILKNRRQTIGELNSFDWESSTGIGVVLGFNNLRAIDFDFHGNFKRLSPPQPPDYISKKYFETLDLFIKRSLSLLQLPLNYEWVVKTPSGGFHIIIYAENHDFNIEENLTKAFLPNMLIHDSTSLKQIELRWDKHLALPPSINQDINIYQFAYCSMPKKAPLIVSNSELKSMLNEFSYDEYKDESNPKYGYNLYSSDAYDSNDKKRIESYTQGEFLDFSPIYFKKSEYNNGIPDEWLK